MTTDHDVASAEPLVLRYTFSYFAAQVTKAAAGLGVADHLESGAASAAEVARACGADAGAMHRLLRAMTALRLVEQAGPDRFVLTADGALLRSEAPGAVGNLVRLFCSVEVWRAWGELESSVRTGRTAWDEVFGASAFDYLAVHPDLGLVFNEAMREGTLFSAPGIDATLDLPASGTVVDVGGGNGALLGVLLAARPRLSGVLFDTAAGADGAEAVLRAAGVADRARVEHGDFFTAVPSGADAYVLKSVIHDWDDGRSAEILRHCRAAAHPGSRLHVIEAVVPEVLYADAPAAEIALFDLNMLVCTGGRERTEAEFRSLLGAAGFALVDVTTCAPANGYSVLTAVPA